MRANHSSVSRLYSSSPIPLRMRFPHAQACSSHFAPADLTSADRPQSGKSFSKCSSELSSNMINVCINATLNPARNDLFIPCTACPGTPSATGLPLAGGKGAVIHSPSAHRLKAQSMGLVLSVAKRNGSNGERIHDSSDSPCRPSPWMPSSLPQLAAPERASRDSTPSP